MWFTRRNFALGKCKKQSILVNEKREENMATGDQEAGLRSKKRKSASSSGIWELQAWENFMSDHVNTPCLHLGPCARLLILFFRKVQHFSPRRIFPTQALRRNALPRLLRLHSCTKTQTMRRRCRKAWAQTCQHLWLVLRRQLRWQQL